ncbi:MAG TPA: ATP-binding protein [Geobacteraceae bacterium]|nr:ATP-binding protein [Geobacteraceae bacterium]
MYTKIEIPFNVATLSFQDGDLEAAFRRDFFEKNLSLYRIILVLGAFLYALFGIHDYWIIPDFRVEAWFIRFAIVCPLLLGIFLFSYSKHFRKFLNPSLVLGGFVAGAGVITMFVKAAPPGRHLYYAGLLLCLLFYYRLRFLPATLLSWCLFLLYEVAAIWEEGTVTPSLFSNTFVFASFIIAGMFMCYSMERYMRSDFLLRRTIQERNSEIETANRALEKEAIDRRQAEEEKLSLETRLAQAQKMEAVGQLAEGIAHEFNNILMAITGYAGFIKKKMDENDPLRSYAGNIIISGDRAARLTRDLLSFSRKQRIETKILDLNDVMLKAKAFLCMMLDENIELDVSIFDKPIIVLADDVLMEQVIVNLASNARDAMPQGGPLSISTGISNLEREFPHAHGVAQPGRYGRISVADGGVGIDRAILPRIFEPFFTTKEVGKGTGLGLSMVFGIIRQHLGFIDVESEAGKGTTFSIFLPVVDSETRDHGRC